MVSVFPGDLPAPELFLDKSSAYVGDTVLYRCLTPSDGPVSFAFLCKDGKEMTRKPAVPGKLSFDFPHHVSGQSSGNYSCGYQHKGLHNQVQSSHLSIVRYLSVTDKTTNSSNRDPETTSPHGLQMILGIAIPTTLGLCLVLYLVITKAACQCKNQREQNPYKSTDKTAAGKLIDASSAGCSHYTGPQGKDKDTENYESLNTRALEISPYSTLHLQQKSEPAISASRLNASSIGCFDEMEPADKEVAGEGYEMLNPKSVQNVLYSTLHRKQ
ncbi:unnamed protein product [Natator depressus]